MQAHPDFPDILLHSDDELTELLGVGLVERETIHLWPLSCVQRLVLADGTKLIYKSQLPPTLEPQFYEAARSPLLPGYRRLSKLGNCETMTLDWIDAPLLRDLAHNEADLLDYGRRVVEQIGRIEGNPPVYVDIGSLDRWAAQIKLVFERSCYLIDERRFTLVTREQLDRVKTRCHSDAVVKAITANPRLAHGDLTADQIFVTREGFRVIDWQRPIIAPPEVDLVALLFSRKIDPRPYVEREIVQIYWFLFLRWAVEAQFDIFPAERWPTFDHWAAQAVSEILA